MQENADDRILTKQYFPGVCGQRERDQQTTGAENHSKEGFQTKQKDHPS
jgi:hypothetical protein